jgi:hypothetical protein
MLNQKSRVTTQRDFLKKVVTTHRDFLKKVKIMLDTVF